MNGKRGRCRGGWKKSDELLQKGGRWKNGLSADQSGREKEESGRKQS